MFNVHIQKYIDIQYSITPNKIKTDNTRNSSQFKRRNRHEKDAANYHGKGKTYQSHTEEIQGRPKLHGKLKIGQTGRFIFAQ